MLTSLMLLAGSAAGFELKFLPSGATKKLGGYMPIRAQMSPVAGTSKMAGAFKIGDKEFKFLLDEPANGPATLTLDDNGDDLIDKVAKWEGKTTNGLTMYSGSGELKLKDGTGTINFYRFDKNDPGRAQLKDVLLYYFDFGYEGTAVIGKDRFPCTTAGPLTPTNRFWIDRNKNGKQDGRAESIAANAPFNIGGVTYELALVNGTYEAKVSSKVAAEIPLPPDLAVGQPAPTFVATATDGSKVEFPKSYKGKVVLLDFWATWCGPCIAELPNLLKGYEKFHGKGLEILGISFDREGDGDKLAKFTKDNKMDWKQVFEGKFWDTTIGRQYGVEGIPFALLVDGDTGKILATSNMLRGEALDKTLTDIFAKR